MPEPATLLFIPESWPFADAAEDTFIAPELPHLIAAFDRLVVAPLVGGHGQGTESKPGYTLDRGLLGTLSARPGPLALLGECWRSWKGLDRGGNGVHDRLARARMSATAERIRLAMGALIAAHRPALVYTYWFHAATIAACRLGLPTATRAHGYDLYEERAAQGFQPFRRWALGTVGLVACVSEHGRLHLAKHYPGSAGNYEVHRLGVASDHRASTWDESRLTLVSCSAAVALKRLHRIAEIAGLVATLSDRPVHWLHLGDGPELPALREHLRTMSNPRLSYELPGAVPAGKVRKRLRAAQPLLFLNQSSTEGAPVGIMEALSCAIPVCAGAVGGIPELVDASNGLLHAADEAPAAVAAAIVALAGDPLRQQSLASGAMDAWRRSCDPALNHARFAARLRAVADAASTRLPS